MTRRRVARGATGARHRLQAATWLATALLAACSGGERAPAASAGANAGGAPAAPAIATRAAPIDLDGNWISSSTDDRLQIVGDKPQLTSAGRKLFDAHRRAATRGDHSWDGTRRCLPPGVPRVLLIAQPFAIAVDAHLVLMTFQLQRLVRFVYLDDAYPTNGDATFLGESHGHWDGNALQIDTTNFKTGLVLDGTGLPAGAQLKVQERLTLADDGTLVDRFAIVDPEMYQRPWQAEVRFRRTAQSPREDICVERTGQHP